MTYAYEQREDMISLIGAILIFPNERNKQIHRMTGDEDAVAADRMKRKKRRTGTGSVTDSFASKVSEFFRTLFSAGDTQCLLLIVVEVARVARTFGFGCKRRLHLFSRKKMASLRSPLSPVG